MDHGERKHWAVVGGGMLGMTLAHRLAGRGQEVTLFETRDHLGGLADAWSLGGVVWDRHYHVTLPSDTHLRTLLAELNLEHEMEWKPAKTGFYVEGKLYSMSNVLEFLRFPALSLLDKIRLGLTVFYASRIQDGERLEKIRVEEWLRRLSGRRTFEKIWLPLLRSKLGENYRQTSAAFIRATIARMYAARRTALKKEKFGYVRGSYARILERFGGLLADEGVEVRTGCPTWRVAPVSDGTVNVELDAGRRQRFDRAVLTVPAPGVTRLCPDLSDDERRRLEDIRYQGVICVSVLLERPLADYYITNIVDSLVGLTGVIEMTALVDPRQLGGHTLVYLPKYVPSDDVAFELPDDEIAGQFLGALERMYQHFRREDVVALRVSRARHVMALPTLGYSERLPSIKTSIPGVYVVNSAQIVDGTLNVNETIKLAEKAIREILTPRETTGSVNEPESCNDVARDRQLVRGS